jgi:4-hydroxybenzoate polyprenyltransferase/phosphoserine phosphatase
MTTHGTVCVEQEGLDPHTLPLVVDLDGTLVLVDTLHEALIAQVTADPLMAFRLPGWLREGKAQLKERVTRGWRFDPARLPYNTALLAYLETERAHGRKVVLCTATHRSVAGAIAAHLGLFDEVIATEGKDNLRGRRKAEELVRRFGKDGFVYAGNDRHDEPVWEQAAGAIVVNADSGLQRRASSRFRVLHNFPRQGSRLTAALKGIRPYQWVKNLICFVPLLAATDLLNVSAWGAAVLLFLGFCLTASSIYLLNDLSDIEADRAHIRKSHRPLASGALQAKEALLIAAALLLAGLGLAAAAGALTLVAAYAVVSFAYSAWLKEKPLVDVFVLAFLYTIRLFAGGVATGHPVSLWLLGFSSFLFLSLALVKRVSELQRQEGGGRRMLARRGYMPDDAAILQMFGCASTFASSIVLSLYVQSDVAERAYPQSEYLWAAIPLLLFWQCRLWLSTARGWMHDDPIVFAARDWVSWCVVALLCAAFAAAFLPR